VPLGNPRAISGNRATIFGNGEKISGNDAISPTNRGAIPESRGAIPTNLWIIPTVCGTIATVYGAGLVLARVAWRFGRRKWGRCHAMPQEDVFQSKNEILLFHIVTGFGIVLARDDRLDEFGKVVNALVDVFDVVRVFLLGLSEVNEIRQNFGD